jgi:hypothetical protein
MMGRSGHLEIWWLMVRYSVSWLDIQNQAKNYFSKGKWLFEDGCFASKS